MIEATWARAHPRALKRPPRFTATKMVILVPRRAGMLLRPEIPEDL